MPSIHAIRIDDRTFLEGTAMCPVCEHDFHFILTPENYVFWEGFCSQCSNVMPEFLPPLNHFTVEGLLWDL